MLTHLCAMTYYAFRELWLIAFPTLTLALLALWLAAFRLRGSSKSRSRLRALVYLFTAEELLLNPLLSHFLLSFMSSDQHAPLYLAGLAVLALSRIPWPNGWLPLRARWFNTGLTVLGILVLTVSGPWEFLLTVLWSEAVGGRSVHYLTSVVLVIDLVLYLGALAWWISPKRQDVRAMRAASAVP